MPDKTVLKNVKANDVGELVQELVNTGATSIECQYEGQGLWTVTAS